MNFSLDSLLLVMLENQQAILMKAALAARRRMQTQASIIEKVEGLAKEGSKALCSKHDRLNCSSQNGYGLATLDVDARSESLWDDYSKKYDSLMLKPPLGIRKHKYVKKTLGDARNEPP